MRIKSNHNGLKNIIFDLGNVLVPLQKERARIEFRKLMPEDSDIKDVFSLVSLDCFPQYEIGQISSSEFFNCLKPYFRSDTTQEDFFHAWGQIIGDFPPEHVEMLKELRKRYNLYLLSNTNEGHVKDFEKKVPGVNHIGDLFEKIYYSHIEGLRKPQPEIYKLVLEQNKLAPPETLFADDLAENIEAASKLGIQTLHVTPDVELPKWFSGL
ncbi:HAD family hydrolase [Anaerophaga thermohalophila]|uniref:HAD family hydrolase n=1 Tax=Anaerophaga thermohalophila TaxID=177400 RepID=UPI000311D723|nr:HAD family phosphatase [Anaerophaga thermohalophila]